MAYNKMRVCQNRHILLFVFFTGTAWKDSFYAAFLM